VSPELGGNRGKTLAKTGVFVGTCEESSSFLKKRTKKLLSVSGGRALSRVSRQPRATDKSFLFLFFKKEILPCFLPLLCLLCHTPAAKAAWCDTHPVALAGVNWESGAFVTAVVQEILQRGYGCRTFTVPGNSVTLEQATANNDVQIFAEEWVNRSDIWKNAAAAGKVRGIGHPFTGATEGWFVPDYVVHGDAARHIAATAPDLSHVKQLADPRYVALFHDPEQPGSGRFLNCPSGWTCEGVNTAKLHAYGLDKLYVDFRPGTGAALDAAITSAYLQGQPLLFYYFSPSAIAGKFHLAQLAEPPYTPACWQDLTSAKGSHTQGCAAPEANIVYGVSSTFAAAAPAIADMLGKATIPLPILNQELVAQAAAQRDAGAQAVLFLRDHADLWRTWLPPEAATRVTASLRQGNSANVETPGGAFPAHWVISIRRPVNDAVASLVARHGAFFREAAGAVLRLVVLCDGVLEATPWWLLIAAISGLAWLGTRRFVLPIGVAILMLGIGVLGLWDLMLQTLTLMLIASAVALLLGLPAGIVAAKSNWARAVVLPGLDIMQTMPSFVYLIPALMLFGLGKVPAILATIIYAVPPMIRLTALGIRHVDAELKEAAASFGLAGWQTLLWVELPLARPSIMAGMNQTIMLALSMVVVASMIGARGLGEEVLNGIQTLDVGRGLTAGLGIVALAIVLDRITQGFGRTARDV
jgi:ABC-type proline/glycine betaine transport system permease subunit/ABC-type proline/glycine betaine transport system substrate-binding protein